MIKYLVAFLLVLVPVVGFCQEEDDPGDATDSTTAVAYGIESKVPCPDALSKMTRFSAKLAKAVKAVRKANTDMKKASGVMVVDVAALQEEMQAYKLDCQDALENPTDPGDNEGDSHES